MSKFVMQHKPKRPSEPRTVNMEIGGYVTLGYLLECVEKFKVENPDRSEREIMFSVEDNTWDGNTIYINAPPQTMKAYEAQMQTYKVDLKAYQMWQKKHPKEIAKRKEAEKKKVLKRKLLRRMERLTKELEGVESKLCKT